jgi:hypothetical protein
MNRPPLHLPFPDCVRVFADGILRINASSSAMAWSELHPDNNRDLVTTMPLLVATGMSTLSTPMPNLEITRHLVICESSRQ